VPTSRSLVAVIAVIGMAVFAAGCSSSSSSSGTTSSTNAATATSLAAFGGMNGLVAACKKEGTLNVITLPANWANYGTIMKDFSSKYGVKINDANPDGSSQDEINAMVQLKGQSRAPAGPTTVQSGQTPIVIWWDYLLASEIQSAVPGFKIVIPTDGHYAAYYSQAISKTAPNPACARLWEEYLYSTTGQNLWLLGKARPIELSSMIANGTVNQTANAALPAAPPGALNFPTQAQESAAEAKVAQQWSSVVG
jgi:spermidine/putrescine-binding protein